MPTSLAPSPTASVTALRSWRRTSDTSSAFCSGDMRQQMTAFDDNSNSSRSRRQSYVRPYLSVCTTYETCFLNRCDKISLFLYQLWKKRFGTGYLHVRIWMSYLSHKQQCQKKQKKVVWSHPLFIHYPTPDGKSTVPLRQALQYQ